MIVLAIIPAISFHAAVAEAASTGTPLCGSGHGEMKNECLFDHKPVTNKKGPIKNMKGIN